jgi:hypothetical protein
MIQAGIKPVYVFDGKPPQLKREELDRRGVRRDDAEDELKKAQEAGDVEAIERFSKRTIKVTKTHVDDCKKLLSMMGVPFVEVLVLLDWGCHSQSHVLLRASFWEGHCIDSRAADVKAWRVWVQRCFHRHHACAGAVGGGSTVLLDVQGRPSVWRGHRRHGCTHVWYPEAHPPPHIA